MCYIHSISNRSNIFVAKNIILLLALLVFNIEVFATYSCQDIKTVNNRAMTTITVEGLRGSLSISAIIDTGADRSVIPKSIADGIGYNYHKIEEFNTVGAHHKFKVIEVKKILMLGMSFDGVEVVVEPKHSNNEMALIGMSELSKTDFSIKDGIFRICGKGINAGKGNNETIKNLEKSCELNNSDSCFSLGWIYDSGKNVKGNNVKAVGFYKQSCELNNNKGCFNVGFMYEKGKGIKQSNQKALEYYGKTCDLRNQSGCDAYLKMNKLIKFILQDKARDIEISNLKKQCDNGNGETCFEVGNHYNSENNFTAVEYYQKSCDLNYSDGCGSLGLKYELGMGVRQNKKNALKYYDKDCYLANLNNRGSTSCSRSYEIKKYDE